jgi:peptide/nickel transport system substrate-binding protein
VNGNVITIRMAKPFPDMSYWGAFAAISPIPRGKASDPASYQNHPWSTGPYMFKEFRPGRSLTLVQNPYWDPSTDPGRHQYLDELDFTFDMEPPEIDQVMLADTGTGQTTLSYDTVLAADYQQFSTQAGDRLVRGSAPCTFWWAPDNRTIRDIRVRQALAYAFPYRAAWAATGEIPGVTRTPATNALPPGMPGRVVYNPLPGHTPWTTDPGKAKELLSEAGKLGYPIRFAYPGDVPVWLALKDTLVQALTAAGFDPQPLRTTSTHFDAIRSDPAAPINLRQSGACSDWPTGSGLIPFMFRSTDIANVGLGGNVEAFSSREVDDRMDAVAGRLLTDQPAAWNALDRFIQMRYFPVVVVGYAGVAMMRGSKVHNDLDDDTVGMPTWKDIWLG